MLKFLSTRIHIVQVRTLSSSSASSCRVVSCRVVQMPQDRTEVGLLQTRREKRTGDKESGNDVALHPPTRRDIHLPFSSSSSFTGKAHLYELRKCRATLTTTRRLSLPLMISLPVRFCFGRSIHTHRRIDVRVHIHNTTMAHAVRTIQYSESEMLATVIHTRIIIFVSERGAAIFRVVWCISIARTPMHTYICTHMYHTFRVVMEIASMATSYFSLLCLHPCRETDSVIFFRSLALFLFSFSLSSAAHAIHTHIHRERDASITHTCVPLNP